MKRRQLIQRQRTQRQRQSTADDGLITTVTAAVADGDDGDGVIAAAPQDYHAAENGTATSTDDVDRIKPDISEGDKLFEAADGNSAPPTSLDNYDFEKAKFRYDYDIDDGGGGDSNNNSAAEMQALQALRRGSIIMPSGGGSNDKHLINAVYQKIRLVS